MPNTTPIAAETYNELLKRDPDAAAQKLADGFLHLINNHIPGIYLSKEEFQKVMPKALTLMSTAPTTGTNPVTPPSSPDAGG